MIWSFLATSRIGRGIAWAVAGIAAVLAFRFKWKREGRLEEQADNAREIAEVERAAHDRINKADTGAGLDDSGRIERLREFAARHGNGSSKTGRE